MTPSDRNPLKEQVALLPLEPGVYQFLDRTGTVIYVGKAKSLRKRVSSYFMQNKEHPPKVRVLVRQIAEIRHIVVDSETDALLLENSLIKELQPRYNILLKDDKTYPWIVVRRENFPRIQSTRQLQRDGSQYFGPYSSVTMQHSILEFIREVIPLRTCSLNLAPEAIARGRYTVCLQYHLGNCKGPCIGAQSAEEYRQLLDMAVSVLKGDLRPVRAYLEGEMRRAAEALQFETAQRYKSRLAALENYSARSVIVSARIVDVDVFSLVEDDDAAYCNFLRIRNGSITAVSTVRLTPGVDTDRAQMLTLAIQHVVEQIAGGELAREVIVPFLPSATMLFDGVTFTVPRRGEKLDLLAFSERSARIYRAEQLKNMEIKNPERHTERLMNAMQKELRLPRQPRHIECFDNSNLQGTNPVASCVVFRDGRPSRKEYRHFNIKTVVGADDFASMREIVFRRYTRLMAEGQELPDLVIVERLCRPARTGTRKTGSDRGIGQTARRDLLPGRSDALLPQPHGRTAQSGVPYPRRGAPLRHHLPPPETQQRLSQKRTQRHRRYRSPHRRDAARAFPHRRTHPQRLRRGTHRADRCGQDATPAQALRILLTVRRQSSEAARHLRHSQPVCGKHRRTPLTDAIQHLRIPAMRP